MVEITRKIKTWIVLLIVIAIIVGILVIVFSFFLILLPVVLILIILGYILRRLKVKSKPIKSPLTSGKIINQKEVIDVEYKVK